MVHSEQFVDFFFFLSDFIELSLIYPKEEIICLGALILRAHGCLRGNTDLGHKGSLFLICRIHNSLSSGVDSAAVGGGVERRVASSALFGRRAILRRGREPFNTTSCEPRRRAAGARKRVRSGRNLSAKESAVTRHHLSSAVRHGD